MKFYCDEMLARVGRWLRTAGYNTKIASNALSDRIMLEQAINEGRLLLSRDRKLAEFRMAKDIVVLLDCNDFNECIKEITERLRINWLYRPFSRCINCNSELVHANVMQLEKVPEDFKKFAKKIWYCQHCDQVYWPGGHMKRMQTKLQDFTGYSL
ncbi:MAG: Mut7-C RNAse domain-containing protein [Gammaproteobacteria bacterium]|nr:Mut7-C RNAse domain-containing protein [Gammaproteobacteria bacterium]